MTPDDATPEGDEVGAPPLDRTGARVDRTDPTLDPWWEDLRRRNDQLVARSLRDEAQRNSRSSHFSPHKSGGFQ